MKGFWTAKYNRDSDCKGCKHFKFTQNGFLYNGKTESDEIDLYECLVKFRSSTGYHKSVSTNSLDTPPFVYDCTKKEY